MGYKRSRAMPYQEEKKASLKVPMRKHARKRETRSDDELGEYDSWLSGPTHGLRRLPRARP